MHTQEYLLGPYVKLAPSVLQKLQNYTLTIYNQYYNDQFNCDSRITIGLAFSPSRGKGYSMAGLNNPLTQLRDYTNQALSNWTSYIKKLFLDYLNQAVTYLGNSTDAIYNELKTLLE